MAVKSAKRVFARSDGDALTPGVGTLGEATGAEGSFRGAGTGVYVGHGSWSCGLLR